MFHYLNSKRQKKRRKKQTEKRQGKERKKKRRRDREMRHSLCRIVPIYEGSVFVGAVRTLPVGGKSNKRQGKEENRRKEETKQRREIKEMRKGR